MIESALVCISLIIAISAVVTIFTRIIKQPPIIAYLIAGVLAGPLFFNIIGGDSSNVIQIFARLGVAFLLFIVGLSLDLRVLKEVGMLSVLGGIGGMIVTSVAGYFISVWLGLSPGAALYIGAVLAFSSTVVVVKILSDKKEIDTLHGRIALGILIVQDFVAAIILMAIPIISSQGSVSSIAVSVGLIAGVIAAVFVFAFLILGKFMHYLARSQEALFLFGVAWALVLATVFAKLGFSLEIGALVAGMSLASSKYTLELGGKIKPLRDFFVILFFVFFGSQLAGVIGWNLIKIAVILSLFILIGKPLINMFILKIAGYNKRTNFLSSVSLAQISEFSLILTLLGFTLGHLSQEIMSLVIMVALITIGVSSYWIYYSHPIYKKIHWLLNFFEGKRYERAQKRKYYDIVLFGYHRIGYKILKTLKEMKASFVVVDYNPKVILALSRQGINCIFGDAADKEFLEEIDLDKIKLVISTIPDENSNLTIREKLKELNSDAVFIATAEQPRSALGLYNSGVDYVIIPHHLGGDYAAHMIRQNHVDKKKYLDAGKKHVEELQKAKKESLFNDK